MKALLLLSKCCDSKVYSLTATNNTAQTFICTKCNCRCEVREWSTTI